MLDAHRRMTMLRRSIMTALALAAAVAASPASACAVHTPVSPSAVGAADLVVVGRIVNYRPGEGGRRATFGVAVAEVLRGRAGRTLAVRLDPTMYGAPRTMPRAPVLIALRNGGGASGPGLIVLQGMCSPPFILEAGSAPARAARRLLR